MAAVETPAARLAALDAATNLQRLIALDDLWTAELDRAADEGQLDSGEIEALTNIGIWMQQGLEGLPRQMKDLAAILLELNDSTFLEGFGALIRSLGGTMNLNEVIGDLPNDLRNSAIAACEYIQENSGSEADAIGKKLAIIREAEEVPPGDFKVPFRCAAMLALLSAGVVGAIGLGGAPIFVGLAVANQAGLAALGWSASGCPEIRLRKA